VTRASSWYPEYMPRKSELVDEILDVVEDPVWENMVKHRLGLVFRTRSMIHMGILDAGLDAISTEVRDYARSRIDSLSWWV
jgi:hypothetical protein